MIFGWCLLTMTIIFKQTVRNCAFKICFCEYNQSHRMIYEHLISCIFSSARRIIFFLWKKTAFLTCFEQRALVWRNRENLGKIVCDNFPSHTSSVYIHMNSFSFYTFEFGKCRRASYKMPKLPKTWIKKSDNIGRRAFPAANFTAMVQMCVEKKRHNCVLKCNQDLTTVYMSTSLLKVHIFTHTSHTFLVQLIIS